MFALFCFLLLSLQSSAAIAQTISQTPKGVTVDCQATYNRALQLVQEYDAKLPAAERKKTLINGRSYKRELSDGEVDDGGHKSLTVVTIAGDKVYQAVAAALAGKTQANDMKVIERIFSTFEIK